MSRLPICCKDYFELMDEYPEQFCQEQFELREKIEHIFATEDIIFEADRYEKYIGLGKYLGFKDGYPWERFLIGLFLCCYTPDGLPRWHHMLCMLGRGAGKDGLISWMSLCAISPYNPAKEYDVDICAFNEEQALRPVEDVYNAMTDDAARMKKFFKWTKEKIVGLKNRGRIRGHTNNAKGKDGLRSGMVILNEIHTYESYANINIFTTGLGKKDDPRTAYFTTNGDVVDGPLDQIYKAGVEYLKSDTLSDRGNLYFICKLDDKKEVDNESMWHKANPSLRYKPGLLIEIRNEYIDWKANPTSLPAFMTKRMNIRQTSEECAVAEWELIAATNRPIPYERIKGASCTVGVDFTKINDWAAVNVHFKDGDLRYDINHAWICLESKELWRLRCPYKEWAEKGDVTLVDAPEINPRVITEYIAKINSEYCVECVAIDDFRYALFSDALSEIGFTTKDGNLKMYRKSDEMRISPVINRYFLNQSLVWGDAPQLRWAANNTKLVPTKKSKIAADGNADFGNFVYGKIEPKSRKTDPFMAFVASVIVEDRIYDIEDGGYEDFDVFVF